MKPHATLALATAGAMAVGLLFPQGAASAADPVLNIDASRVDALVSMATANPATFGGVSLDEAHGTVTVRYAKGRAAALSRLRTVASAGAARGAGQRRINMVAVSHSYAELDALRQKVMADAGWRRLTGDTMSEWYVDITRNVVSVGVAKLSPELTAAARARFGYLVELHKAARPSRASRTADWAPWAGGILISSGAVSCSTGIPIEVPGTPASRVMVTAGHCFPAGASITNNGQLIGLVSNRNFKNNGIDFEQVGGSFTPWTYKGPSTSDFGDTIRGTKASVVGQTFCTNGAISGETCSGTVNATNLCVTFNDGITTCKLDRMTSSVVLVRPGDSGGNIFAYDAAGLKVGGIIIGGGSTAYFHPISAVLPMGWRVSVG